MVLHAVLRHFTRCAAAVRLTVPGRGGDGGGNGDLLLPALAGSRQGQIDTLSRPDLQSILNAVRDQLPWSWRAGYVALHTGLNLGRSSACCGVLFILPADALVHEDSQNQARTRPSDVPLEQF